MSPYEVAEQVVAAHPARATAAGVALVVRGEPGAVLRADPVRLRQMVGNPVSNAVRHTPAGGRVTVHAREDGSAVVFEVTDTGTGIARDDLPHVFARFRRADKSRNRRTGGTGLGLAIVQRLTRAHDGEVTAHSTLGEGSTFTIRLPGRRGAVESADAVGAFGSCAGEPRASAVSRSAHGRSGRRHPTRGLRVET
ncbi:sensor histidine kinase [Embleya sp. NPDC059237]|uniref:sensor histidine kinase n=1 Tax=Embleya sp. NPDC059237 TaxID=3346784 RepID=UPI0036CFC037